MTKVDPRLFYTILTDFYSIKLIVLPDTRLPRASLLPLLTAAHLSLLHESEPDTSADELAIEETAIKRMRHMPRAQSRHDPVTSRHPTTSTSNVSPHPSAHPGVEKRRSLVPYSGKIRYFSGRQNVMF